MTFRVIVTADFDQMSEVAAGLVVEDIRRELNIIPKSEAAWLAGSVTAWEKGGISPYQYEHGQAAAAAAGRPYQSFGATPA